ncbi:MAG: hypothetical protein ACHREM_04335 [Polyangiales bacterium]
MPTEDAAHVYVDDAEAPRNLVRKVTYTTEACTYFSICMSEPTRLVEPSPAPFEHCEKRYHFAPFAVSSTASERRASADPTRCYYQAHECKFSK